MEQVMEVGRAVVGYGRYCNEDWGGKVGVAISTKARGNEWGRLLEHKRGGKSGGRYCNKSWAGKVGAAIATKAGREKWGR